MRQVRFVSLSLLALWLVKVPALMAQAPMTDEEKKRAFLRAREEMQTVPATPSPDMPRPKPKPVKPITPAPEPPKATPRPMPEATPRPKPMPEATPKPKPSPEPTPRPRPEATPAPTVRPLPTARPQPPPVTPAPRPAAPPPKPDIKVTADSDSGDVPAPPPAKASGGFFSRIFGGRTYEYLTKKNRAEIDGARVQSKRWRYIVVHNSGTRQGNAKAFEYYHRYVRKMPNGLAYQFVIGNGSSSGDGEIEIGNRWRRQTGGGHVHSDYLNNISLGICLVGDFNRNAPTKRQLAALDELIDYLRDRVGKTNGKVAIVKAHRAINPPRWPTDCPGNRFPYSWLQRNYP